MSSDASSSFSMPAIRVRGLGKSYTIRRDRAEAPTTLAESIANRLRHPLRRARRDETFEALRDISFEVPRGDVVGIIGPNGAGKSTLLKILSRITPPTRGEVDLLGRVGALLEVGSGFHQELTGRENIFLNGAILGMSRSEVRRQFDAIVEFAAVEPFLDTPVKRYSSGMYVRLAFAVAAHLRCEIMLIDEVLAVGDEQFQRRCLGKMRDLAGDGRTVLFVSHNMHSIATLCRRAMLLREGRMIAFGDARDTIAAYANSTGDDQPAQPPNESSDRRRGSGEYRFTNVRPVKPSFAADEQKVFEFRIERRSIGGCGALGGGLFIGAHVVDCGGQIVVQCDSRLVADRLDDAAACAGTLRIGSPWLRPGDYRLDLYMAAGGLIDVFEHACRFRVAGALPYERTAAADATERGVVLAEFQYELAAGGTTPSIDDGRAVPAVGAATRR